MRKGRPPEDPGSSTSAYLRALRWLTVRELSESQVRTRLGQAGYAKTAVDAAVERLLRDRTIDDRRAASAVARTEARVRRHGPRRVLSRLVAMQFSRELAREVVAELFGDEDETELLEAALDRRLRGRTERLTDVGERRKLVAYLVRQGFPAGAAMAAVRGRSRRP